MVPDTLHGGGHSMVWEFMFNFHIPLRVFLRVFAPLR